MLTQVILTIACVIAFVIIISILGKCNADRVAIQK